jgi:hypothetical protein
MLCSGQNHGGRLSTALEANHFDDGKPRNIMANNYIKERPQRYFTEGLNDAPA